MVHGGRWGLGEIDVMLCVYLGVMVVENSQDTLSYTTNQLLISNLTAKCELSYSKPADSNLKYNLLLGFIS